MYTNAVFRRADARPARTWLYSKLSIFILVPRWRVIGLKVRCARRQPAWAHVRTVTEGSRLRK
eukprot:3916635-Pleurochrysis_carterae.AAC.1